MSLPNPSVFLEKLFARLQEEGIDVSTYELDHVCYRVETIQRYEQMKQLFSEYGTKLAEVHILNRSISTFKLDKPFMFRGRSISVVELPAPRDDLAFAEGFEHAEFVIGESFELFMNRYPSIKFNTVSINRETNPDIIIDFEGFAVKFHHQTLESTL